MTDREFIKTNLQKLQKILEAKADEYISNDKWDKAMNLSAFSIACSSALELLKEQDAIRPEPIMGTSVCDCGKCKHAVAPGMNYCPTCGCQIDWN